MTLEFTIKSDFEQMERELNDMQRKQLPKAFASALNKTAAKIRTQAVRRISAATGLKQKEVRKRYWFNKSDRASTRALRARQVLIANPVPLSKFGKIRPHPPGKKRPPVGARFKRAVYPSAFVATMKSGFTSIFQRRGKERLEIDEIRQTFDPPASRIVKRTFETVGAKEWPIEIARAINRFIPGAK